MYYRLAAFIENIIFNCDENSELEKSLRNDIVGGLLRNKRNYHPIVKYEFKEPLNKYLASKPAKRLFFLSLFDILKLEDIRIFIVLNEMEMCYYLSTRFYYVA